MRTHPSVAQLVAVTVVALAAVACSNDDGEDRTAPTDADRPGEEAEGPTSSTTSTTEAERDPATGAGWPDEDTTGVPTGTELRSESGEIVLSEEGEVLEGVDLDGCVKVTASNVVIRRSRISCGGEGTNAAVHQSGSATGLLIEDTEITGPPADYVQAGVYSENAFTVRRTEISGHDDGAFVASGSVIEDSWIHSLAATPGAHNDTLQMVGGNDAVIRGNRLEHRRDQTSAIIIKSDLAPIDGITIEDNYMTGGSFTVYVYAGRSSAGGCCDAPTNARVIDNVIEIDSYLYGAMTIQGAAEVRCNITSDGAPVTYYDSDRLTNPTVDTCD